MDYRVLGPLQVASGDAMVNLGGSAERTAMALFILHPGEVVSLASIEGAIWDFPPADPEHSIQVLVAKVRRALQTISAENVLVTEAPGYRLAASPNEVDAHRYERGVVKARRTFADGRLEEAEALLADTAALWRGPPLAEFSDREFALPDVRRLEEIHAQAQVMALGVAVAQGRHEDSVAELVQLVGRYPFREPLIDLCMVALYRSGRQRDALATYDAYVKRLQAESGVGPGDELVRRERQIRQRDPDLRWRPPDRGPRLRS